MSGSLHALHADVEALKAERRELTTRRDSQVVENRRLERALGLLERGKTKKRRLRFWLLPLALILLVGGGIGWQVYRHRSERRQFKQPPVVIRPAYPRLLVTSRPSNARVLINAEVAGVTPLLKPLKPGRKQRTLVIEIRARGHKPRRGTVTVTRRGGAHFHAVLESCKKGSTDANCRMGR